MQVDDGTLERYRTQQPSLCQSITSEQNINVMVRDEKTDHCIHYSQGLCGIHASQGTDFLGDACHFFPRITRQLGNTSLMTAAPSCPEITRLAIIESNSFNYAETSIDRSPYTIKNYLPSELSEEDALVIHQTCVDYVLAQPNTPETNLSAIISVARSLHMLPHSSWKDALSFYLKHAASRLPHPEAHPEDMFHALHMLSGLVDAAPRSQRDRLEQTIRKCEDALKITLHRGRASLTITEASIFAQKSLIEQWHEAWLPHFTPILNRWIALQLSESLFPFSGFGSNLTERATLLGVRYSIVKLALMAACHTANGIPTEHETIRAIQSISRFMDHLSNPELSLRICQETGWNREPRLLALIYANTTFI